MEKLIVMCYGIVEIENQAVKLQGLLFPIDDFIRLRHIGHLFNTWNGGLHNWGPMVISAGEEGQ